MWKLLVMMVLVAQAFATAIDVFDATQGHEPRVAINCGKVPFYVDLKTGAWVGDAENKAMCDGNSKEDVKNYCKKIYPNLNVTNIVESNEPVVFHNWCEPEQTKKCDTVKEVVPYRCLVHEYEADALMVPNGCHFGHLHDEDLCLSQDQWEIRAQQKCQSSQMKLKDYGILLSCGTDLFTGVEFVCCPKKTRAGKKDKVKGNNKKTRKELDKLLMPDVTKEEIYHPDDDSKYVDKNELIEEKFSGNQSAAFTAVIVLFCGALIIWFGIWSALVVRRRRNVHTHVLIPKGKNSIVNSTLKSKGSGI